MAGDYPYRNYYVLHAILLRKKYFITEKKAKLKYPRLWIRPKALSLCTLEATRQSLPDYRDS